MAQKDVAIGAVPGVTFGQSVWPLKHVIGAGGCICPRQGSVHWRGDAPMGTAGVFDGGALRTIEEQFKRCFEISVFGHIYNGDQVIQQVHIHHLGFRLRACK